jgi:hypothetical protein
MVAIFLANTTGVSEQKIFSVNNEYQADIKVFFTDKEYRTSWKKNDKKPLLHR